MQRLYLNKDGVPWYVSDSVDSASQQRVIGAQDPPPKDAAQSGSAGALH